MQCQICSKQFNTDLGLKRHMVYHTNPNLRTVIGAISSKRLYEKSDFNKNAYYKNPKKCLACDEIIPYKQRANTFCGHSCATSTVRINFKHSNKTKNKMSISHKQFALNNPKPTKKVFCTICEKPTNGRKTCSDECLNQVKIKQGQNMATKLNKRSKLEIKLANLCKSTFSNITFNQPIINGWDADIILHDTKIAILWQGPWHYEQLTGVIHSLKQVQNRDKLKRTLFEEYGWLVLEFRDNIYTPEYAFKVITFWSRIRESNSVYRFMRPV